MSYKPVTKTMEVYIRVCEICGIEAKPNIDPEIKIGGWSFDVCVKCFNNGLEISFDEGTIKPNLEKRNKNILIPYNKTDYKIVSGAVKEARKALNQCPDIGREAADEWDEET